MNCLKCKEKLWIHYDPIKHISFGYCPICYEGSYEYVVKLNEIYKNTLVYTRPDLDEYSVDDIIKDMLKKINKFYKNKNKKPIYISIEKNIYNYIIAITNKIILFNANGTRTIFGMEINIRENDNLYE